MKRRRRSGAAADEAAAPEPPAADLEDRAFRFIMGTLAMLSPLSQVRVFRRLSAVLAAVYAEARRRRKIHLWLLPLLELLG